jgi:hypothetical protein
MIDANTQAILDEIGRSFDRFGKTVYAGLNRMFGQLSGRNEEPFLYTLRGGSAGGDGFLNLSSAVGNVATGTIHIGQDADFLASNFHMISLITASGVVMPPQTGTGPSFSALIRNLGTDRQLMNVDSHGECIFGTGQRSVRFTKNWLVRRNSDLQIKLTNLQGVATQVWISLWGYKIFDDQALNLTGKR